MAVRVILTLLAAVGLVARDGAAQTAHDLRAVTTEITRGGPSAEAPAHGASCLEFYWNAAIPVGSYFPAGAGVEVLDDLHLGLASVYPTEVCAFDIGYFKEGAGVTEATVSFYWNSPADGPPGPRLATFQVPGLPSGENFLHVEVPASELTPDVWAGVSFSTGDAGLLIADPPSTGASDDYFYMRPANQFFTFGGNPRSNFLLAVYATGPVVAVDPDSDRPEVPGFRAGPSPNPATEGVTFRFAVRDAGLVRAHVLDVAGRVVAVLADKLFRPGVYTVAWDGRATRGDRAAAGVYLLRLTMPGFAGSRKIVLVN